MREYGRTKGEALAPMIDGKKLRIVAMSVAVFATAFAVGWGVGRRAMSSPEPRQRAASNDPLAQLDEPVKGRNEAPVELKAAQVLADSRPLEKAIPPPAVRDAPRQAEGAPKRIAQSPPPARAAAKPEPRATPMASAVVPEKAKVVAKAAPTPAAPAVQAVREPPAASSRQAPSKGAYTIQIASSSSRADAERLASKLAHDGARVVAADVPGKGRWYRVQCGEFETKEAAKVKLAALGASGVQGIVTPVR